LNVWDEVQKDMKKRQEGRKEGGRGTIGARVWRGVFLKAFPNFQCPILPRPMSVLGAVIE
jgi:hypothetical protein